MPTWVKIESRLTSKEELLQVIARWAEAKSLEQFFADAERRVADLDAEERLRILNRLKHARQLIGSADALERLRSRETSEER